MQSRRRAVRAPVPVPRQFLGTDVAVRPGDSGWYLNTQTIAELNAAVLGAESSA
jgi:hypothetical protein